MNPTPLPEYKNPPVTEVVCGAFFDPKPLLLPDFGLLWMHFRDRYPRYQHHSILAGRNKKGETAPPFFEAEELPLPRVWFLNEDESRIVQIQRDAFITNWKKVQENDEYPRYENVFDTFETELGHVNDFLKEREIDQITPVSLELTYVNHIVQGEGWETLEEIGEVFPDLAWRADNDRFLSHRRGLDLKNVFSLPDDAGLMNVAIRTALRTTDKKKVIAFELSARGAPSKAPMNMAGWFAVARESIVRGFTDLSSPAIQKRWGRTK